MITYTVTIHCDHCSAHLDPIKTTVSVPLARVKAEAIAQELGWRVGGQFISCPKCCQKQAEPELKPAA